MPNSTTKNYNRADFRDFKVIWFEKGVRGQKSRIFDSFDLASDFAYELLKNPDYHGVHIISIEIFCFRGDK